MKFICDVIVEKPAVKVAALYHDPNYFHEWQDGFLRIESKGDYNKIFFKQGKREMMLKEVLQFHEQPFHKKARYEHAMMTNTLESTIEVIDNESCRVRTEIEYVEIKNFLFRIMIKISPGILKNPPQKWLTQFKEFAEWHID